MKALIFLLWGCSIGAAAAQDNGAASPHALVEEGVKLYDAGKYDEAVAKYQQALKAAPGDETATSELALTYNALGRDAEAAKLCEKLLKANPAADQSVYVTYGNSLDALKKTKEASRVYEQGLKRYPNSYSLHYNQGVAQATSGQAPAAIASFQQAVALNPGHASSHLSLGVMQLSSRARVPAVLALGRFLVLEPRSARATQRLPLLDQAMTQGVSKTGSNAVTINISEDALNGTNGKSSGPDNFGPAELLLSISGAAVLNLPAGAPVPTEIEQFSTQFGHLCKTLGELNDKQKGFTWNYYVPYFVEMEKKGYAPAFAYLSHSSQTTVPEVQQWLTAHPAEVAVFQEWSKNYVWPKPLE
ncbi:tetratricopeptide repeat protein [Hymenobacter terricola]|uniref:tetratricopeptide repeat protein n=1 Tax=Hymenobacter terricola TaxID=2819236 RepID=UPI001B30A776|nr:tetratricopeptide repeat protein [Hymenobacter terricola]